MLNTHCWLVLSQWKAVSLVVDETVSYTRDRPRDDLCEVKAADNACSPYGHSVGITNAELGRNSPTLLPNMLPSAFIGCRIWCPGAPRQLAPKRLIHHCLA